MKRINPNDWVTLAEAARILGISPQRVDQLVRSGMLTAVRPWSRVTLVSLDSIKSRQLARSDR